MARSTDKLDVAQSTSRDSAAKFLKNLLTRWWIWRPPLKGRRRATFVVAFLCALLTASSTHSETASKSGDKVLLELVALGAQGSAIVRARDQVLDILQRSNACSAWFQEADPDPAGVFRSLHFDVEMEGPSYVVSMKDTSGRQLFKHPWAAKSMQNAGPDSVIQLNAHGPFFSSYSFVIELSPGRIPVRATGTHSLAIFSYGGNTPKAQDLILLHELGHIVGRLPEDDDSWDGRSIRNTSVVLKHCNDEIRAAARNSPGGSI